MLQREWVVGGIEHFPTAIGRGGHGRWMRRRRRTREVDAEEKAEEAEEDGENNKNLEEDVKRRKMMFV